MAYTDDSMLRYQNIVKGTKEEAALPSIEDDQTKPKIPQKWSEMTFEEQKKLVAKTALVIVVITSVNLLWFGNYIRISDITIAVLNLLTIGGLLASYLHGNPQYDLHTKVFVTILVAFLFYGFFNNLEYNRKQGNGNLVQTIYNNTVNHFTGESFNPTLGGNVEPESNKIKLSLGQTSELLDFKKGTFSEWISLAHNQSGEIQILIPEGHASKYSLHTRSGKEVKVWNGEKINETIGFLNEDFRLFADKGDCLAKVAFLKK